MKIKVKLTKLPIVWTTTNCYLGYPQKGTLNSKGVKLQAPLLHKLTYKTIMTESTNDFNKLYCKIITQSTNKCKDTNY